MEPGKTIAVLLREQFVKSVIAQGETKVSFLHVKGPRIDIEIVPIQNFGSLLQHFTGSKDHNIALRTYAESQGKSISEWGVKRDDDLIPCSNEECVYDSVGMAWIPPELRENRGELESALTNTLPDLVGLADIRGDLHVHSNWSDGNYSIEEMAQAAKEYNLDYIAITDHTISLAIANGLNVRRIKERQEEIESVRRRLDGITILSGLEVNIGPDGRLDIADDVLVEIDVVVASIHTGLRQPEESITHRLIRAMENPHVDIIGHPSGRLIGSRQESAVNWPEIFRVAVRTRTVLEINASPLRLDLKDTLVQQAQGYGVKFAIDTDAHSPREFGFMQFGVDVARRGWLEKKDVVNTLSLTRFRRTLK